MTVHLQPAFILHRRPFRETSLLLDVFTREYGCVSLIAKGVKSARSKWRGVLEPFSPLFITYRGKTELMNLQIAESAGFPVFLQKNNLTVGFYLNELLIKLLQKQDPHPILFDAYQDMIFYLAKNPLDQKILRLFEKKLLEEIGYGLPFKQIEANQFYYFCGEQGFVSCSQNETISKIPIFSGKNLLALHTEELDDLNVLQDAKKILRFVIAHVLGNKTIQSRKLFR